MIHPTAVIASDVHLPPSVRIGPYTVIESGAEIGERCIIGSHVTITGHVTMGADNSVDAGSVIGGAPQDVSFKHTTPSRVVIGSGNQIREHVTIHRAAAADGRTLIGNHCLLMVGAHVGHDSSVESGVIMANGTMLGGHVHVCAGAFIGGGAAIHQFVRIGRLAICQGNSAVTKSLPPFTMAAGINGLTGLNIVGMRRAGISAAGRASIKRAFELVYRRGLNTSQALELAREQTWERDAVEFLDFVGNPGKRGLCGLRSRQPRSTGIEEENQS